MSAPAWFRYGVMTTTLLMLCACRTALPEGKPSLLSQEASPSGLKLAGSSVSQHFDRQVQPVVYQTNTHAPPPAARQAEYAAGVRTACPCCPSGAAAACPEEGCGSCQACGVRPPASRDEYLCDGGDDGLAVGVRKDWKVDGLEQEDTVAHYDTVDGRTVVTPSNQVCIYAPRFGVVRRMVDLHEYARSDRAGGMESPLSLAKIDENEKVATSLAQLEPTIQRVGDPASLMRERQQLGGLARALVVVEIDGSLAPYADLQVVRSGAISNDEKALVARASLAAITWSGDQSPQVEIGERHAQAAVRDAQPGTIYHLRDPKKPRLRLVKLASTGAAQLGELVEFTLRFDNIGTQVVGNVTIMDHLTTRLEYVEGSATSSVKANFLTEPHTDGSTVLRWEIDEPIEAGQGGVLQFKCKVR
jgi:uncharacterized repeat protein (TIGR01451 family)